MDKLFDTGPLRREAILKRLGATETGNREPMGVFDKETRGRITRALNNAAASVNEAALELCECGEYDYADYAADVFEALESVRKMIEKED